MRNRIGIHICPREGCPVVGQEGRICPAHRARLIHVIFVRAERPHNTRKPPPADAKTEDTFGELRKVVRDVERILKDAFGGHRS